MNGLMKGLNTNLPLFRSFTMKVLTIFAIMMFCSISFVSNSMAIVVTCPFCSDKFTQQLQHALDSSQLVQLAEQLNEMIIQTQQQIQMVVNQIKQYENMIKNTLQLPLDIYNQIKGLMKTYAELTDRLRTIKGEVLALGQIFDEKYPGLDMIKQMANGDSTLSPTELWDQWSQQTDEAIQATFQASGALLHDIVQNAEALDNQISNLLSTPEGQMQAIQASNALSAIQIAEFQKLTAIVATSIQSAALQDAATSKRTELSHERWQNFAGLPEGADTSSLPRDSF
jgi:P-type conjugative transfer protein TrbJ